MRRDRKEKTKRVNGSQFRIAIAVSRYNSDITEKLLDGAREALKKAGVKTKNIEVVYTPGAFEIPLACERFAKSGKYSGIIALGCIIRGETDHDFHLARAVTDALMDIGLRYTLPIGLGVLTVNTLSQAKMRSSTKNNAGRSAAEAVLEMI